MENRTTDPTETPTLGAIYALALCVIAFLDFAASIWYVLSVRP